MKKLVIGVDLDDTLLDFNDSLHEYHNSRSGTSIKRSDITAYELEKVWNCSAEEAERRILEFYGADEHHATSSVEGAVEAIRELAARHDLHIITSRGDDIRGLTLRWVEKHFPGRFLSVNFANQVFGPSAKMRRKSDICAELGVQVMVEDSMSQARDIAAPGRRVFLIDAPWNQGDLPANVTRVRSWDEIVKMLQSTV